MNIFKGVFFMQILMSASIVAQPPDTVGTIVWYPPIQLSDSAHNAYQPRIALSGDDTIHVTWWYGTWG